MENKANQTSLNRTKRRWKQHEATIQTNCKIFSPCFASGEPPPEDGWAPLKTGGTLHDEGPPTPRLVPTPRRLGPGRVGPLSRNNRRAGQNEVHALPSDDTRLFQSYDTIRYHTIATVPVTQQSVSQPTSNLVNHQPVSQPITNQSISEINQQVSQSALPAVSQSVESTK